MGEKKQKTSEERILLTFLQRTKEGCYAPIEKTSLPYARIKEETESAEIYEEEYYYGIS